MTMEITYLQFLKCSFEENSRDCCIDLNNVDWRKLFELCVKQNTVYILYKLLPDFADNTIVSDLQFHNRIKYLYYNNVIKYQKYSNLLLQVCKSLRSCEIEPILLKGFSLSMLYPSPYYRHCGDLDILVGKTSYHMACEVLRKTFVRAKHPICEYEQFKHYNFDFEDGRTVELHRITISFPNVRHIKIWDELEEAGTEFSNCRLIDIDGEWIRIPEFNFNFLFVFVHSWEHYMSTGMSIGQLCDILLLCKNTTNISSLSSYLLFNLKRLNLLRIWKAVAYILVKKMWLSEDLCPLFESTPAIKNRSEKMWKDILKYGQYKKANHVPSLIEDWYKKGLFKRKIYTFILRSLDISSVWSVDKIYAMQLWLDAIKKGFVRLFNREEDVQWNKMI